MPSPERSTLRDTVSSLNDALQDLLLLIITIPSRQSESPLHPAKMEPEAAIGVRETTIPEEYASEQSLPQLIPAGLLFTLPLPLPSGVTTDVMPIANV